VFAYVAGQRDEYHSLLQSVEQGRVHDDDWRFQTIYGLLWPRGRVVRERALDTYNPFADFSSGDRLLVVDEIPDRERPVDVTGGTWGATIRDRLRNRGVARISSPSSERSALQQAILTLVTETVETDFLQVHPRLNGIERTRDNFVATLTLPEVVQ